MSGTEELGGGVEVLADAPATAGALAAWLMARARRCIAQRGTFHVALTGGSTPRLMYAALRRPPLSEQAGWERWHAWFGDERAVPPEDEASNFHLARELLDAVPIPPEQVHRMEGERPDLAAAAAGYADLLERLVPPGRAGAPRLDVVLLGLGENGHTASLFPGDPSVDVVDRWAVPSRADYAPFERITLTFPVINAAAAVAFAVTGGEKGEALRGVIAGTAPAARVRPADGELRWFLDEAAASSIR